MIKDKGDLRSMFLCLWDIFRTYPSKEGMYPTQKTCLEDAAEFFRQISIISKIAEKKMVDEHGFSSDIKPLYVLFYPKFAACVTKKKDITIEYLREKMSEFIQKGKLGRKNREILTSVMDDMYKICKEM